MSSESKVLCVCNIRGVGPVTDHNSSLIKSDIYYPIAQAIESTNQFCYISFVMTKVPLSSKVVFVSVGFLMVVRGINIICGKKFWGWDSILYYSSHQGREFQDY